MISDIHENVIPHVAFLQSCIRAGVRRYIFLSSGGTVYGPKAPIPTPETAPARPINSYGLTKLIIEKYIQMHGYVEGLEYFILRVSNPFGPGQQVRNGQGLIPSILNSWQTRSPLTVLGNGSAVRDYIYVDDLIDAIEAAVSFGQPSQTILNIGSGEPHSVTEVVDAIELAVGTRLQREYVPSRNTDVDITNLAITRAREVLGWAPKVSFPEGIERTVRAARHLL
jgi:UDP-glucose 4-epimerase